MAEKGHCGIIIDITDSYGITDKNGEHEYCECPEAKNQYDGDTCKVLCSEDSKCKGYSYKSHKCRIYTISSCPRACDIEEHIYRGTTGELINSGFLTSRYSGCIKKTHGNIIGNEHTHSITI